MKRHLLAGMGVMIATIAISSLVEASFDRAPEEQRIPGATSTNTPTATPTVPDLFMPFMAKEPTRTPTPTATPTQTPTPTSTATPAAEQVDLFCSIPVLAIPDNDPDGLIDSQDVDVSGTITDMDVYLNINHTWVGDLIVELTNEGTNTEVTLLDRPGRPPGAPPSNLGCNGNDVDATLDDEASDEAEDTCDSPPATALRGRLSPNEALSAFDSQELNETWTLVVSDNATGDFGTLNGWCLLVTFEP